MGGTGNEGGLPLKHCLKMLSTAGRSKSEFWVPDAGTYAEGIDGLLLFMSLFLLSWLMLVLVSL